MKNITEQELCDELREKINNKSITPPPTPPVHGGGSEIKRLPNELPVIFSSKNPNIANVCWVKYL